MQVVAEMKFPPESIEKLFPCKGEEGAGVYPSSDAKVLAGLVLNTATLVWHTPDVFAVRYGSNYVATARAGHSSVRFLSTLGDFQEGDDK